jgi:hypothetical protein
MVREHQVDAAGLDVEGGPQVFGGDRSALDVPARPAAAEPGVSGGLALVTRSLATRCRERLLIRLQAIAKAEGPAYGPV